VVCTRRVCDCHCLGNSSMSDSKKLYNSLMEIHSALDDALGDSDVTHIEDDDELRSEYPTQWAAQKLAELIAALSRS
jgi:hypothetical protein